MGGTLGPSLGFLLQQMASTICGDQPSLDLEAQALALLLTVDFCP